MVQSPIKLYIFSTNTNISDLGYLFEQRLVFWKTAKSQIYPTVFELVFPTLIKNLFSHNKLFFFLLEENNPTFLVLYSTVNALSFIPDSRYAGPEALRYFNKKKVLRGRKHSLF